jgi:hypothetical protein
MMFGGAQPSSLAWSESDSFRHYLYALHAQAQQAERATFDETVDAHNRLLDSAHRLVNRLTAVGIGGEARDFGPILPVNRAALASLLASHGAMLRRHWGHL